MSTTVAGWWSLLRMESPRNDLKQPAGHLDLTKDNITDTTSVALFIPGSARNCTLRTEHLAMIGQEESKQRWILHC